MTKEEYVKKLNKNKQEIYNSIIEEVSEEIENANVYENCRFDDEEALLLSQLGNEIIKDLEKKYPFLTFELSNWNTVVNWELKKEKNK